MKVYIVTANYVSPIEGDADFIIDSVWIDKEEADKRAKGIDDSLTYPEGIYSIPYYGEVIEKEVNGSAFDLLDKKN